MHEPRDELQARIRSIATKAVGRYARGILTSEALEERIVGEVQRLQGEDEPPSSAVLMRLAQHICSRELYCAWASPDSERRNCAFSNLRRYLGQALLRGSYAILLQQHAYTTEDVLHQALETLQRVLKRQEHSGPDDPAAFLKWARTIVIRQAQTLLQKSQRQDCLSLDAQMEIFTEQVIDEKNGDPLDQVLLRELQQVLRNAILSLQNRRYREVLVYGFLLEVDEREVAQRLHVRIQEVYMWRHRALKTLRNTPEVINALRSLRE